MCPQYAVSCVKMKSIWIYLALVVYFFHCCLGGIYNTYSLEVNSEEVDDNSNNELDIIETSTLDPQMIRMEQQLDELYELAKQNIRTRVNVNANTADIIRDLIEANVTGLLQGYPASCPPFARAHGIYTVNVTGLDPFPVYCDSQLAGVGWTVIQRRIDGNINFYRNWTQYRQGFGNISSEFFIGLDKLHAITAMTSHELYIFLEDFEGNTRYAHYDDFLVSSQLEGYKLTKLGDYSGDAGDSLRHHLGQKFSTFDMDNDGLSNHICVEESMGAWWHGGDTYCDYSSLNGLYLNGNLSEGLKEKGIYWHHWKGVRYSYKSVQMMIRPKCLIAYPGSIN